MIVPNYCHNEEDGRFVGPTYEELWKESQTANRSWPVDSSPKKIQPSDKRSVEVHLKRLTETDMIPPQKKEPTRKCIQFLAQMIHEFKQDERIRKLRLYEQLTFGIVSGVRIVESDKPSQDILLDLDKWRGLSMAILNHQLPDSGDVIGRIKRLQEESKRILQSTGELEIPSSFTVEQRSEQVVGDYTGFVSTAKLSLPTSPSDCADIFRGSNDCSVRRFDKELSLH